MALEARQAQQGKYANMKHLAQGQAKKLEAAIRAEEAIVCEVVTRAARRLDRRRQTIHTHSLAGDRPGLSRRLKTKKFRGDDADEQRKPIKRVENKAETPQQGVV